MLRKGLCLAATALVIVAGHVRALDDIATWTCPDNFPATPNNFENGDFETADPSPGSNQAQYWPANGYSTYRENDSDGFGDAHSGHHFLLDASYDGSTIPYTGDTDFPLVVAGSRLLFSFWARRPTPGEGGSVTLGVTWNGNTVGSADLSSLGDGPWVQYCLPKLLTKQDGSNSFSMQVTDQPDYITFDDFALQQVDVAESTTIVTSIATAATPTTTTTTTETTTTLMTTETSSATLGTPTTTTTTATVQATAQQISTVVQTVSPSTTTTATSDVTNTITATSTSTATATSSVVSTASTPATVTVTNKHCQEYHVTFASGCCPTMLPKHPLHAVHPHKRDDLARRTVVFSTTTTQTTTITTSIASPTSVSVETEVDISTATATTTKTTTTASPTIVSTSTEVSTVTVPTTTSTTTSLSTATATVVTTAPHVATRSITAVTTVTSTVRKMTTPAAPTTTVCQRFNVPKFVCPPSRVAQSKLAQIEGSFLNAYKRMAPPAAPSVYVQCDGSSTTYVY